MRRLSVLILNSALALRQRAVRAAPSTTLALATEESEIPGPARCSDGRDAVVVGGRLVLAATEAAAEEEHDAGEEHHEPGGPGEAEGVAADVGAEAGVSEGVASFDEDDAGCLLVLWGYYGEGVLTS